MDAKQHRIVKPMVLDMRFNGARRDRGGYCVIAALEKWQIECKFRLERLAGSECQWHVPVREISIISKDWLTKSILDLKAQNRIFDIRVRSGANDDLHLLAAFNEV